MLERLALGQVIEGSIANIVDYGLFVNIGGINGLLHRSELLEPFGSNLRERFQPGMSIYVEVANVDRERKRIELIEVPDPKSDSERPRPWRASIDTLAVGQVLEAAIANIVDYGLFVDLGGINGLLHRSKLIDPSDGDLRNRFARRTVHLGSSNKAGPRQQTDRVGGNIRSGHRKGAAMCPTRVTGQAGRRPGDRGHHH